MRNPLSKMVAEMEPSGIRRFFDVASTMDNVISLGVGEPDFDTPWHIREEGIYSLEKGRTFYTSNAGLLPLRNEVCTYLKRRFALSYDSDEVIITVGGSEAIDIALAPEFKAEVSAKDKVDDKKMGFMPAVELSYIKPKNQRLIAVSIDGEQASPSLAQAKRLRELDKEGKLNEGLVQVGVCIECLAGHQLLAFPLDSPLAGGGVEPSSLPSRTIRRHLPAMIK